MRGTKLINSVIFKFTKLIDKLEKGIVLLDQEQEENDDTVAALLNTVTALEEKNDVLAVERSKARNIAANLRKLLGINNG